MSHPGQQEIPFQVPDVRREGMDAKESLLSLPLDCQELVFDHLPLAQKARAARVCKSWATRYTASLAARQQQLKSLKVFKWFLHTLAIFRLEEFHWERNVGAEALKGYRLHGLLPSSTDASYFEKDASIQYIFTLGQLIMATTISADPADSSTMLLDVEFGLVGAADLPALLGLLLMLAQEVLPKVYVTALGDTEASPRRLRVQVRCDLGFASGWEDWAPLAGLCKEVRLTVSPDCSVVIPFDGKIELWSDDTHWQAFPADDDFTVIARGSRGDECPLSSLHIKARSWEPAASATCLHERLVASPSIISDKEPLGMLAHLEEYIAGLEHGDGGGAVLAQE